jgi:hypothetical protein
MNKVKATSNSGITTRLNPKVLWGILAGISICGAIFRSWHITKRLLWLDEIHSYRIINQRAGLFEFIKTWWHSNNAADPPLFYLINYAFSGNINAPSHLQLRLPTLIMGILCIPAVYVLVHRIMGERVAILAAFLMSINTFAIQYSQEYRPYAQLLLTAILFLIAQFTVCRQFTWKAWSYLLAASLALIYTHYFGCFALASGYVCWIAVEVRRKIKKLSAAPWAAILLLPLVVAVAYSPVFSYALTRAKAYSSTMDPSGSMGKQMLKMYLANKANSGFFGNLASSMFVGYLVQANRFSIYFYSLLTVAGCIYLGYRRPAILAATCTWITLSSLMSYFFYEVFKFPYEPRRSIFQLPAWILLLSTGIYGIFCLLRFIFRPRFGNRIAQVFCAGLLILCFALATKQFSSFDNWGYRSAANQADWLQMAEFVDSNAGVDDSVMLPVISGNTWALSQFGFYYRRIGGLKTVKTANTVEELRSALKERHSLGWYVLTSPWEIPPTTFEYLVKYGQWQNFAGGSVILLSSDPQITTLNHSQPILIPATETGAIAPKSGSIIANLEFTGSTTGKAKLTKNAPFVYTHFNRGITWTSVTDIADSTTNPALQLGLYPVIKPDIWHSASQFSEILPRSSRISFPVVNGKAALCMRYNGIAKYRFWLEQAGNFELSIEAANDKPGPITARVFSRNSGELPLYTFNKADNECSIVSHPLRLKKGLNELTVYYNSFRRIPDKTWNPEDSANQFIFTKWKLGLVSGGNDEH